MHDVGDVRGPVGDRADGVRAGAVGVGGDGLREDPEPRQHRQAAVLELLDLERVQVLAEEVGGFAFGEVQGVEAPAGEHATRGDVVEGVLEQPGAVALGAAHQDDLQEDDPQQRPVVRRLELVVQVGDGARVKGALLARHEPGRPDEVLLRPRAGDAQHREAAVDDLRGNVVLVLVVRQRSQRARALGHGELAPFLFRFGDFFFLAFRVSGLVSFWLFSFLHSTVRDPRRGARAFRKKSGSHSVATAVARFFCARSCGARGARARGAPRLRARAPRRRVPRTLSAPASDETERDGAGGAARTYRVDVDVAAPLGVLLERDAVLGHARVHLEAGARLDVARGGLGDQAGRHGGAEGYGGHLGSGLRFWGRTRCCGAKGASRDLKNVFSSKSYTSGSARKRSRPDRGCRRSIERAGRAAGSPFALIDSVSKKIAKIAKRF